MNPLRKSGGWNEAGWLAGIWERKRQGDWVAGRLSARLVSRLSACLSSCLLGAAVARAQPTTPINNPILTGTVLSKSPVVVNTSGGSLPSITASTLLQLGSPNGQTTRGILDSSGSGPANVFTLRTSEGTFASPSALLTSDYVGGALSFSGYDGSVYQTGGWLTYNATQPWTPTAHGSALSVETIPNNASGLKTAAVFGQDQSLTLTSFMALDTSNVVPSAPGINGVGYAYTSTTYGASLWGKGSTGDVALLGSAGTVAAYVPTGTQNFTINGNGTTTGTSTLTGLVTLGSATGGQLFTNLGAGTTTHSSYGQIANAVGVTILGVESSTGGSLATGTAANASVFGSNSTVTNLISNGALALTLDASQNEIHPSASLSLWGGATTAAPPSATQAGAQVGTLSKFSAGATASSTTLIDFYNTNGVVGSIAVGSSATTYATSSDGRLKTNIREIKEADRIIDNIHPILYDWKSGDKEAFGFSAQDLYRVFPSAVLKGDDDATRVTRKWGIDYAKLVPVMVAEEKELRFRVHALAVSAVLQWAAICWLIWKRRKAA